MLGEWLAGWAAAFKRGNRRRWGCCLGLRPTVGDVGLKVFKLHLKLFDQLGMAFRTAAILFPPKLGDLQPEVADHVLGSRNHGAGLHQFLLRRQMSGPPPLQGRRARPTIDCELTRPEIPAPSRQQPAKSHCAAPSPRTAGNPEGSPRRSVRDLSRTNGVRSLILCTGPFPPLTFVDNREDLNL